MVSKPDKLPQWVSDNFTDHNLKLKAITEELDAMKAGMVTKADLTENFGKHNKAINDLFVKYDKDVRGFITDQIVQGVTEGIKQYDAAAKQNFVTRGDMAAAGAPDPTHGTPIQPGQQQQRGRGFLDIIGDLVMKSITGGGGGEGNGIPSWAATNFQQYQKAYERRLQLNWQAFLKQTFEETPVLPSPAGSGHVELSG